MALTKTFAQVWVDGVQVIKNDIRTLMTEITNGSLPLFTAGGSVTHAAGTLALAFGAQNHVTVTPNATGNFTSTVPAAGTICTLEIVTSGTTSYTMTFTTGFKTTGTLVTGTTSARTFMVTFKSNGTALVEMARTVAMA